MRLTSRKKARVGNRTHFQPVKLDLGDLMPGEPGLVVMSSWSLGFILQSAGGRALLGRLLFSPSHVNEFGGLGRATRES